MPRVGRVLSAAQVKELSKKVGEHSVGGVAGLLLSVRASSAGGFSASWVLRKQGADGFRIGLGSFPEVSLKAAREKAAEIRAEYTVRGQNPAEIRREIAKRVVEQKEREALEASNALTIGDLYEEFFDWKEKRGDWKDSSEARRRHEMRFRKHILPLGSSVPVSSATADDVARIFMPIWCDYRTTADKLLPIVRMFFAWATYVRKVRDGSLANPADRDGLAPLLPSDKARKPVEHFPFLEPDQLPPFMAAIRKDPTVAARCLEVAILTCSRSANIRAMRWDELSDDLSTWTISAEDMKVTANGQHIVPLSRQAQEIIQSMRVFVQYLGSPYVFPSPRDGKPYSVAGLNRVIRVSHKKELLAGREGWIDREQSKKEGKPVIAVQHAISRATFETWAHGRREDERIIALCLHHDIDTKLKSAYDRDKSLDEKRALLQRWADFCYGE